MAIRFTNRSLLGEELLRRNDSSFKVSWVSIFPECLPIWQTISNGLIFGRYYSERKTISRRSSGSYKLVIYIAINIDVIRYCFKFERFIWVAGFERVRKSNVVYKKPSSLGYVKERTIKISSDHCEFRNERNVLNTQFA